MRQKYVRVTEVRDDKFVLFDFAIGDPELSVELILPLEAFREFCAMHQAVVMTPAQSEKLDQQRLHWQKGGGTKPHAI